MGLTLQVDEEQDGYGYILRVWNERFTATTELEVSALQLRQFAGCIAGFPADPGDERSFVLGTQGTANWGGHCSLHFRSTASSGRAVVDVALEANQRQFSAASAKAEFSIPVEAAAIDRFVRALHGMAEGWTNKAGW